MDIKKYIYSHCVFPKKVKIWDAYTQSYIYKLIPCGKCLHCTNTRISEWITRLVAQRKYSEYCYFVSLDYAPFDLSNKVSFKLAKETAACYHNINKNGTYGMHPLLICKNHLQDFFKRLRKNLGSSFKIQYFACGEYGTHANGRGYARPHYHCIIFSNSIIDNNDFSKAWSINGYSIGRVDVVDMNNLVIDINEQTKIFKYVCKYLQKSDFDFEMLATIDFHRAYFESINFVSQKNKNLFENPYVYEPSRLSFAEKNKLWKEYIKSYSPFIVCSRRPAIGSAYLAENMDRFKEQDFRLFGLPMEGLAFPRYFLRKTKESLCPFVAIGSESEQPTTSSRLGYITKILTQLYNDRLSLDNWCETPVSDWCLYNETKGGRYERYLKKVDSNIIIKCRDLSFYDSTNKILYQFDGYFYNLWAKFKDGSFTIIDTQDIFTILSEISPYWYKFHFDWITPLHNYSVNSDIELLDYISNMYQSSNFEGSYSLFQEEVYARYKVELESLYKKKLLMQNSKQNL